MEITVKDFPPEGKVVEDQIPPEALGFDEDMQFRDRIAARVELQKSGRQVTARGRISTVLMLSCHRCCEPFELRVECGFENYFLPRPEREIVEQVTELNEVELGLSYYDDERIDLGPCIHDAVLLDLPLKQLCQPDCAGLCPSCGQQRTSCGCDADQDAPSNPFAEFFREQGMS